MQKEDCVNHVARNFKGHLLKLREDWKGEISARQIDAIVDGFKANCRRAKKHGSTDQLFIDIVTGEFLAGNQLYEL